jgi:hypothetical protein
MLRPEEARYAPGSRVEVRDERMPDSRGAGIVLYVGSDEKVLVGWDDETVAVLPPQALALTPSRDVPG